MHCKNRYKCFFRTNDFRSCAHDPMKHNLTLLIYILLQKKVRLKLFPNMFDWQSSPKWTSDHKNVLMDANNPVSIPNVTLAQLIEQSSNFPVKFPIDSIKCCQLRNLTSVETLERFINSAYPIIHEYALYLCTTFLLFQRQHSPRKEYYQNMSLLQLIDKFLSKRAVMFMERVDHYLLLDGKTGFGGWESVGTEEETLPLTLENCLSYGEMRLSAFLSVSSLSVFINDGDRYNMGEVKRGDVEESGVIIGLIGPRLEKPKVMEYRDVMKTKEQDCVETPGLEEEFRRFYGGLEGNYDELLPTMETSKDRYVDIGGGRFFDRLIYERRISISIDTLLLEANERAKKENKMAYVHVVGLGLGVWKIYAGQNAIFMDTFAKRLELLSDVLTNVSDVRFAYIRHNTAGKFKNGDKINGIKIHIEDKNPQVRLRGNDEGKLLVVSYPWDGNAFPGNEFWGGSLSGSGDPAAASSTQVAELHNWYINKKVSGGNLRVATFNGVVTFEEYQQMHKDD